MSYYLSLLVLFLAVISLTNGRNYSPPTGGPHIHPPKPLMFKPPPMAYHISVPAVPYTRLKKPKIKPPKPIKKAPVPISVPGVLHIDPPRPSRPPP